MEAEKREDFSQLKKPPPDTRFKTEDVTKTKGHKFELYRLRRELLMGIYEKGYENPSPIQEEAIPLAIAKKDILARAKNGTGKTASFLIPALNKVRPEDRCIQILILVPTRELALQTSQVCKDLGKYIKGLEIMATTGGTSLRDDIIRLEQNISIVVATPGRILDLAERNIAKLNKCDYIVMDEADKLLTPEFEQLIEKLLPLCAENRQLLMFLLLFLLL